MSRGRFLLLLLTLLAFALAAFALLFPPPPLWVPLSLGGAYLVTLLVGVLDMRLQMFGPALCSVPTAKEKIALTFDDGPDPVSTPLVLKALKEAGAQATFFVIGRKAALYPELLRAILAAGHSIGVHSYTHHRLYSFLPPSEVKADIERCLTEVEKAAGHRPLWFRPPIGQLSPRTAKGIFLAQVEAVGFSVRARDAAPGATVESSLSRVLRKLKAGDIVLLHDAWERKDLALENPQAVDDPEIGLSVSPVGVRLLEQLLVECQERKLKCVTLEELVLPTI